MAARWLYALLPRSVLAALVWLLATATLTFAAEQQLVPAASPPAAAAAPDPNVLLVPDVRRQAYVFAKSILEDAGFAWRVDGTVKGYAANLVASQQPAPGTRVIDTGAPVVVLRLSLNRQYPQRGAPENASPYTGTRLALADLAVTSKPKAPIRVAPKAKPTKPKPAAKPAGKRPAKRAAPVKRRQPAFVVPGAPKEPIDEISLPARAMALARWLGDHRRPARGDVRHWVYQHAWIVTGAKFGWSGGAEALRILIGVHERVQNLWGIGARSEATARRALAYVEAQSR
jgi:hypothetical protein